MFCMLRSFRISTVSGYDKPECRATQNPWSVLEGQVTYKTQFLPETLVAEMFRGFFILELNILTVDSGIIRC